MYNFGPEDAANREALQRLTVVLLITDVKVRPPRSADPGLPWADRGTVAVQDLRFVLIPRGGGPVGVQDQRPAPAVNHHLVVEPTQ